MKKILAFCLFLTTPAFISSVWAQEEVIGENETEQAVTWAFHILHKTGETYELQAKARIKPAFHLWALNAGGDGTLIPTSFTIEDENIQWQGDWKESKQPEEHTYEFIDGAVRFFTGNITFSRSFSAKSIKEISGSVDFQTCNEEMCFPPETVDFTAKPTPAH